MDGAPVRGESIPIRLFLSGYELTPTMRDINKKFSVRYYINLVLVDEEERRYFKQQVSIYYPTSTFLYLYFLLLLPLNYCPTLSLSLLQEIVLWRKLDSKTGRKSLKK